VGKAVDSLFTVTVWFAYSKIKWENVRWRTLRYSRLYCSYL